MAFPVKQFRLGVEKIRLCVDYRNLNKSVITSEKVELPGVQLVTEASYFLANGGNFPVFWQCKHDLTAQIQTEKAVADRLKSMKLADSVANIIFLNSLNQRIEKNFETDPRIVKTSKTRNIIPYSEARDLKSYYYQFATAEIEKNNIAVPLPSANDVGGKTQYNHYQSKVCVFGSLTSVHSAVFGSELHNFIMNTVLMLVCFIYIDDIHLLDSKETIEAGGALIESYLNFGGWGLSEDKTERQNEITRCLVVLGMAYTLSRDDRALTIGPNPRQIESVKTLINQMLNDLSEENKCLSFSDIEKLRGKYRYVTQTSKNLAAGYVRPLDLYQEETQFRNMIGKKSNRINIRMVLKNMLTTLEWDLTLLLTHETANAPAAHVYSDAAIEGEAVSIGGWFHIKGYNPKFFAVFFNMSEIPNQMRRDFNIQTAEAIGSHLAYQKFFSEINKKKIIAYVDNQSDCYSFIKGYSGNIPTSAVIATFHHQLAETKDNIYWYWISTTRNLADCPTRLDRLAILKNTFPNARELPCRLSDIKWEEYGCHRDRIFNQSLGQQKTKRRKRAESSDLVSPEGLSNE